MSNLPIGIQDFVTLRHEGYTYVDKTQQIFSLLGAAKFLFLARPRRFGKSLLLTTIKAIFEGKQELFTGLWIEDKIDWTPRPVLLLNFNDIDFSTQSLSVALARYMDGLAADHHLQLHAASEKEKFRELLERLAVDQKVVLLIDEYDKAIPDVLEDEAQVREHVATLKNFYSVLKASESDCLHYTLLTGVSKYGKISIFSDLNHLLDVTLDRRFATLLGYTQDELEHYFGDYIDQLTGRYRASRAEVLAQIKIWYNGYSWDGVHRVYVPFSTLVFFSQQTFANHWFITATPTFLIKLLRQKGVPAYALEEIGGDNTLLDSADLQSMSAIALLFQTGYLTVKAVHPSFRGDEYILGYPNYEVEHSFKQHLLTDYLTVGIDQVANLWLRELRRTLQTQNLAGFITILKAIFASIPHTLFLAQEAYYHSVVYLVLSLLGFTIYAERLTNLGRLDAVLEEGDTVYVIEFKMSTAQIALDQIRAKGYDTPYHGTGKAVILLGIAFDKETRNIIDWKTEQ